MKNINKIMVGIDFSTYSKDTLAYAAALAEKFQAELIIVNVINKRDIDTILKVAEGQFDRKIEKYVEKTAEEYTKKVKEDRSRQMEKLIDEILELRREALIKKYKHQEPTTDVSNG